MFTRSLKPSTRVALAAGTAAIAILLSSQAGAQGVSTAPATPVTAAEAKDDSINFETVIVTGVANRTRKFDASFAVSNVNALAIQKLAPLNMADLLGQLPGVFAEATGGEVQNVYRVRGIPNEGNFQAFHEDGMPVFQDNDGIFFKGDGLIRPDIMTKSIEFVRGGPAPVFASNAAAIYNTITRQGTETPEGSIQTTLGDTGLYRAEGYWSGPVGEKTYLAVGGFLRRHNGYRDNGFPNDEGGQIRVNLRREIEGGEIRAFVKYLNDKNVFYLPIPVADPRNPSVSLDRYIDLFTGTLNTPTLQNAVLLYPGEGGQITSEARDLSDGRHMNFFNTGIDFDRTFGAWTIENKARFTKGVVDFDALYSTSNPADANTFAAGQLAAANAAFGTLANPVTRLGYAIGGTNGATVYNPALDSGLVLQAQYRAIKTESQSVMNDLRISRQIEWLGTHALVGGLYLANFQTDFQQRYQDYLFELKSKPRTLDLVAYGAANQVLGSVTDKGVLRYGTVLNGGSSDISMHALYLADNWQVNDKLRLEAGLRYEKYSGKGFAKGVQVVNLGNAATLADNAVRGFTSAVTPTRLEESVTAWTVGANYEFNNMIGFYGRASKSFRVGGEGNLIFGNAAITTEAEQFELGAKFDIKTLSVFLTGFYTKFTPFNASFQEFNPATGTQQLLTFVGEAVSPGVEVDFSWRPASMFRLEGSFTYNDAKLGNFFNQFGAIAASVDGNQPIRQPKTYGNLRPTLRLTLGDAWDVETYLRYNFVGDRYVDLQNRTLLPAYNTLAAGITVDHGPWRVQFVGENLTNERGLTEGNPRTDQLAGQGSSTAIYGRPLFGANYRLVTSYKW
ncbi:CirA Outer membrane receptor proteins, mostly Fe transport [Caulobacteraceae bacterium]